MKMTLHSLIPRSTKESFFVLLLSAITSVFAGLLLGASRDLLLLIPGLITLLPGSIGMRGSIFAALGSRLSSSLHLGTLEKFSIKSRTIKNNIYASLTLSLILSTVLGIFASLFSTALGIPGVSVFSFIAISVITGILSGVILLAFTFFISFRAFEKDWDPDNVTAPMITTLGDLFTIPALLFSASIILAIESYTTYIAIAVIIASAFNLIILLKGKLEYRSIMMQSIPVLTLTAFISTFAGIIMEANITSFEQFPTLLVLLPAFIGQCGNIGNILAARFSTAAHMGSISGSFKLTGTIKRNFYNSYLLSLFIFPFISVLAFFLSTAAGIESLHIATITLVTLVSGLIVTTIVIAAVFVMSIFAFRHDIDPDNILIPIISNTADVVGVIIFVSVIAVAGVT
jgi:mgtE-like transporter